VKTIYDGSRFRVAIPSTRAEWLCLAFSGFALASAIKGDINQAFHLIQIGLLCVIAEKVEK